MNWGSLALWGFIATVALTSLEAGSQGFGISRMSIPYILGSMATASRDRAKAIGLGVHLVNGWLFALLYGLIFQSIGMATWYYGAIVAFFHAMFVLTAGMWILPAIHPRMASEQAGPTARRQLEPPGFLALNYGYQTPISVIAAHLVYGALLGSFYTMR